MSLLIKSPTAGSAFAGRKPVNLHIEFPFGTSASIFVSEGKINFEELQKADDKRAIEVLTEIYGVGVKVASCIALFGMHHLNAFPRDVWMKRILENEYPNGYPFSDYAPYNGVYQQYMFAYYRNVKTLRETRS